MDYCLPCRRHLNGALVCPGCGTPADRIPGPARVGPENGEPEQGTGGEPREPGGGRAERRSRKAAAHRRKRRRTALLAVGFALAAGGLGLAELGTDAPLPFTGGGTATVKDTSAGDSSGPSARTTAPPQVSDVSATSGPTASASGSPSAGSSASASPSATSSTATAPPSATTAPGSPVTAPTTPATTPPTASPPTTAPATSPPPPAPSPTRTCDRFLWWCT
ncbi:hypothetical protein [Streptomyces sp. AM6-12]|uniref:SCO2400 family protein n=1 Tax=Streptomyces sp. AM6-12 TaxID=3345149 RepID=UPI0037BD7316